MGWQDLLLLGLALLSIVVTGEQLAANWKAEDNSRKEAVMRQNESDATEEVEDLLLQAEASQRGYLLTGRPTYLAPYLEAVRNLPEAIAKLGQISVPEPDASALKRLAQVSQEKVEEMAASLKAYDQKAAGAPNRDPDRGRLLMEEVVRIVGRLQSDLLRSIEKQTSELERYHRRGLIISLVGGSLSFIMLCLSLLRLNRSFGRASDLIEQIRAGEKSYQLLADHVEEVREAERREMARRIHDEVGQALTATKIDLSMLERKLASNPDARETVRAADEALSGAIDLVRGISMELRPAILDALGLFPAVEWQAGEFAKRLAIDVNCSLPASNSRLDPAVEVSVFRIVQEALTNVARHSRATKVEIRGEDNQGLRLMIRDNGVGIPKESFADYRSMGLLGMKERARAVGGALLVRNAPGGGAVVELHLPQVGATFDAA